MRFSNIVPFLPLASAFVITEPEVFRNIHIEKSGREIVGNAQSVVDAAFGKAAEAFDTVKDEAKSFYSRIHDAGSNVNEWLEGSPFDDSVSGFEEEPHHPHHPPHHGKPHEPPHDDKPNRTVYEVRGSTFYPLIQTNSSFPAHQREQVHHQAC